MSNIREAVTAKAQATIPMDRIIQGAHLYDRTRRWVGLTPIG